MDRLGFLFMVISLGSAAVLGILTTSLGQNFWKAHPTRRNVAGLALLFLALVFGIAKEYRSSQLATDSSQKADAQIASLQQRLADANTKAEAGQRELRAAHRDVNLLSHQGAFQVFPPLDEKFIGPATGTFAPGKVMCGGTDRTVPADALVLMEKLDDGSHALRVPFHHNRSEAAHTNWWAMILSVDPEGSWRGFNLKRFNRLVVEAKFENAFPGQVVTATGDGRVELKVRLQDAHGGKDSNGCGGTGWCNRSVSLSSEYQTFVFDLHNGFGAPFAGEKPFDLGLVMQVVIGQDGDTPAAHGTVVIRRVAFVP